MMHRIVSTTLFFCLLSVLAAPASAADAPARKPNFIVIVGDDLGYADVGCQGQSTDVKTPHIDSIAAGGVRFTSGYVSGAVCSPTRAGLMTGRYGTRFGFEQNPKGPHEEVGFGLPLDEVTLPQQLKKVGYATGMVGKWHLGHLKGMLPHERGFDSFFGFTGGLHRYINNEKPQADANAIQRNGVPVGEPEYLTDAFTREALSFIDASRDKPFFLYLPYNAVHTPQQAPPKYVSRFADVKDEKRKMMLAQLSAMDDGVGQVLAKLRERKIEKDTLVVFFSDNGGPTPGNGSLNNPFRGRKGQTLEGGIRIPFMMQWPGRLPEGKVDDRPVIQLDLFATLVAAARLSSPKSAGGELPAGKTLDGVDLIPVLTGQKSGDIHEALYWRFGPWHAMRAGKWKLQWSGEQSPRLFDVNADPAESKDLAAANPKVLEDLLARYKAWDATLMKPRWAGRTEGGVTDDPPGKPGESAADEHETRPVKRKAKKAQ
jgi:arylsulfatase A-like enzyme